MTAPKKLPVSLVLGVLGLIALVVMAVLRPDTRPTGSQQGTGDPSPIVEQALLDSTLAALSASEDPGEARQILAELKANLFALPREEAVAAITEFLADPARDTTTGLEFAIGESGRLETQPTLRVSLLDWLAQIDPVAGAIVARDLLATPTTPDEWAICLRNVAWGEPGGEETSNFLNQKWEEMVANVEWRAKPTIGYLEAFDVLVHTRATTAAPRLAELAADTSQDNRAVAHASFLTLDRLVLADPAGTLQLVTSSKELLAHRGSMVAQLVARANLSVPSQRHQVAAYLLDPGRSESELGAFAAVFPNANYMMSNNLLTRTKLPGGAARRSMDQAALDQVELWLADERFTRITPWLEKMRDRLEEFVNEPTSPAE